MEWMIGRRDGAIYVYGSSVSILSVFSFNTEMSIKFLDEISNWLNDNEFGERIHFSLFRIFTEEALLMFLLKFSL